MASKFVSISITREARELLREAQNAVFMAGTRELDGIEGNSVSEIIAYGARETIKALGGSPRRRAKRRAA